MEKGGSGSITTGEKIIRDTRFCNCSECADESEHCDARLAFVLPTSKVVQESRDRDKQ